MGVYMCCTDVVPSAAPPQVGQEEYYDYIFPEEAGAAPGLKLLEAAYRWKRQKAGFEAPDEAPAAAAPPPAAAGFGGGGDDAEIDVGDMEE
jgi:hypothetical protein